MSKAIEADPLDGLAWLALADEAEELGDRLAWKRRQIGERLLGLSRSAVAWVEELGSRHGLRHWLAGAVLDAIRDDRYFGVGFRSGSLAGCSPPYGGFLAVYDGRLAVEYRTSTYSRRMRDVFGVYHRTDALEWARGRMK